MKSSDVVMPATLRTADCLEVHVVPPSVVLKIVADSPAAMASVLLLLETPYRFLVVPEDSLVNVFPISFDMYIVPPSPTVITLMPSCVVTPLSLMVVDGETSSHSAYPKVWFDRYTADREMVLDNPTAYATPFSPMLTP
jgi:hypothetical protein